MQTRLTICDLTNFYKHIGFMMERLRLKPYNRNMISFCQSYFDGCSGLVGVEIGVQRAINSVKILKLLPVDKLYLVDPYAEYTNDDTNNKEVFTSMDFQVSIYQEAVNRIMRTGFKDKVRFVKKYSENAVKSIPDNLDFVYIDGNHDYEFVMKDLRLYYPKVRVGGVIGGHDWTYPSVSAAVVDFCRDNNLMDDLVGGCPDFYLIKP